MTEGPPSIDETEMADQSKRCSRCGLLKSSTDFWKQLRSRDGLQSYCKVCHNETVVAYQQTARAREAHRAAKARYQRSVAGKAAQARYNRSTGGRARQARYNASAAGKAAHARHDRRFPERVNAITLLNNALKSGRLTRQPCEVCGAAPAEGHHPDYSKPLEVRWLCRDCHKKLHCAERQIYA